MRDTEVINRLRSPVSSSPSANLRPSTALAALRRFVRPRPVAERCELCGLALPVEHPHLVELSNRHIACACAACAVLFDNQSGERYRRIPRRVCHLADFRLDEAQWAGLTLPVNLAFFFHSSPAGRVVAVYPSPAGATESLLDLSAWDAVAEASPLARELVPDVEALIVHRSRESNESYLVPIDVCYELVGQIRMHWTGFDGGEEARQDITDFFARVRSQSRPIGSTMGSSDA